MKLKWTCNNTECNPFCTRDVYFFLLLLLQIDNLRGTKFSIFKNLLKLHISEITRGLLFCLLTWWSSFCLGIPQFTNKPPPKVVVEQGTTVTLCCVATGFPRPKVEWTRHQRSTLFSPFFQEDGCLAVKKHMVKKTTSVEPQTAWVNGNSNHGDCYEISGYYNSYCFYYFLTVHPKHISSLRLFHFFFFLLQTRQENVWQKS